MTFKYKEGNPILDHINDFQGVLDQLSEMGVNFDDEIQGLWLLNTLPDSWETLHVSLTKFVPGGKMTMEYAKSGVLNEEVRRKSQGTSSHSDVLYTEDRGRDKTRDPKSRGKSRSKSRFRNPNTICHHCGKKGHIRRFCKQLKQDLKEGKKEENNGNNVVDVVRDDLLFACDKDVINFVSQDTSWIVDSGATSHVTPRKDLFASYTSVNSDVLNMGNAGEVKVFGVGTVCLKTNSDSTLVLQNVLISFVDVGRLTEPR
ncbi:hypothetical protein KY285_018422 [Solanum tuberosum]|nr:hypothetical protein KY284_018405 [Solanum tuberosum]KAH0691230.1 hypothetical protein KY289_018588 [Solanum tuberosum]KAH0704144.1 hypothetical protein KY285_018422 [Solanum tuberosum]